MVHEMIKLKLESVKGKCCEEASRSRHNVYSQFVSVRILKQSNKKYILHCYFTRSNLKKMGPLQFCLPALLEIHRNTKNFQNPVRDS